jgi:hypothetical protein
MSFSDVIAFFNQGWVGVVTGIVLSTCFYYLSKRDPKLSYLIQSATVVEMGGSKHVKNQISVTYRGERVPRLTATVLTVWNSGRGLLNQSHVAAKDPLRLVAGRVLEATLDSPRQACGCRLQVRDDVMPGVYLDFDYLEPEQGMRLTVLHTGTLVDPTLLGSLKGIRVVNADNSIQKNSIREVAQIGITSVLLTATVYGLAFFMANLFAKNYLYAALFGVGIVLSVSLVLLAAKDIQRRFNSNSQIPKALRSRRG